MLTLYSKETTSFSTLGIGVLRDFISHPLITEELNGAYTLEFEYAKDGYLSEYLIEQNIIKANGQAFRIWNIKKDMQKITVLAKHIFFDLSFNFLADVFPTNLTAQSALAWMLNRAAVATNFSATGNCTQTASTRYVRKNFIDAVFNEDNALLKKFGGELSYDNFNITVHEHRGTNANFSIRYKKNLTGIDFNLDFSNVATRIVPIGFDGLTIDSTYVESSRASNYFTPLYKTYEFSDIKYDPDDEEAYHTLAEAKQALINAANDLFTKNVDLPQVSISVNFVELSKCSEYASYSNLETVHLGDTIDVIIPELNIHTSARVNKTVYDCILDRFITLEIGSAKQSITRSQIVIENQIRKSENYLTQAQQNAENLINHPFNGNVYIDKENGVIYLMDSTSPETAQNVWKWSLGGLGFSSTGINGTYTVAILQDGRINADFITTGQLDTGVIQGYDSLLIQVDTLDREFQKEINPTDTSSGSSITLEDSAETELIDFELEGKTTQETRSGKNLFNVEWFVPRTTNGITATIEGDHLLLNGTATANAYINFTIPSGKFLNVNNFWYVKSDNNLANLHINETGSSGTGSINITPTTSWTKTIVNSYASTGGFLLIANGTTLTNCKLYIDVRNTNESVDDFIFEPYGVMPSPDYPSELNNVGYKNLAYLGSKVGNVRYLNNATSYNDYIFEPGTYTLVYNDSNTITTYIRGGTDTSNISLGTSKTITFTKNEKFNLWFYRSGLTENEISNLQLVKGTKTYPYIPYGKYGIEIKTIGKNILLNTIKSATTYYGVTFTPVYNSDNMLEYITANGTATSNISASVNSRLYINKSTYYTLSGCPSGGTVSTYRFVCYLYDKNNTYLAGVSDLGNGATISNANVEYANLLMYISSGTTCNNLKFYPMLEKGTQATEYEPYKENTQLYVLDEPLRSIGNTKDLLYIKNGMLYVERKIGSVVLDGSENWSLNSTSGNQYRYWLSNDNFTTIFNDVMDGSDALGDFDNKIISNYFIYKRFNNTQIGSFSINNHGNALWFLINSDITSVNDFKTWLSTHNTKVQYILAQPYTEEVGKTQIPITYKGITYINTTDELEPNISITYVRDTLIANYVESYVREIKITENGIESRVQNIEESDYGGQISAVEERTTSTEKNIEVISTNIDTTTGEVRKVTTTNGMTFDENGLNIHTNLSTFNAQHTYDGTYYRDGEEVITETTINGFKATNLKNKGQHEYSYDDTHNLYEFIDERIEVDGEYCYATFYNGEE